MAQPSSRSELITYCKRQLGAPVLEINVADEQVEDLVDDALQYFHERHFTGVTQMYLKYKITQDDIDRGRGRGSSNPIGIVTTTQAQQSLELQQHFHTKKIAISSSATSSNWCK